MGIQYRSLSAADIREKNVFLAGDNDEQLLTCRQIIGTWKELGEDAPLVVFDHSGNIYSDFGGGNLLADCESEGSVMPDCLMPVLRHAQFGCSAQNSADIIRKCAIPERPDRYSNDSFWTTSASHTLEQYIEYGLVLTRDKYINRDIDSEAAGGKFNTLLTFAGFSDLLCGMMSEIASPRSKYNNNDNSKPRSWERSGNEKSADAPKCNLSYAEQFVFDYAKYGGARNTIVFDDLQNTGVPGNAGTANCVLKTANANGRSFLRFMDNLCGRREALQQLPVLDLDEYVRSPDGKILFVCSTGDNTADQAFASLILTAIAAAEANEGKGVTVLLPEIDKWDTLVQMQEINSIFGRRAGLVFGCADISAIRRKCAINDKQYFAVADSVADTTIWHKSVDKTLKDIFNERNAEKSAIYGPEDLGEGLVAYKTPGQALQYLLRDTGKGKVGVCAGITRSRIKGQERACPWFFDEESGRAIALRQKHRINMEKAVESGLPEELADAIFAGGLLDSAEIDKGSVGKAVNDYLTETLADRAYYNRLTDDELEAALKKISCGRYEIVRHEAVQSETAASSSHKQLSADYVIRLFFKTLDGELKKKCESPARLAIEFEKYCTRNEGDCFAQLSPEEQKRILDSIRQTLKNHKHRSGAE